MFELPEHVPSGWRGELPYLPWDSIVAQYHAKRAAEIAIIGGHSIFFVGALHSQCEDLALWCREHGAPTAYAAYPCPCGWLGDDRRECTCSPRAITAYVKKRHPAQAPDIWLEMPRVQEHEIQGYLQRGCGDPWARVLGRIEQAQALLADPAYASRAIDEAGNMLLGQIIKLLDPGPAAVQRMIAVARTIATAAGSRTIQTSHLAEAIHYRRR